ncbi:MAG TPA: DNA polymerase III subunit alpha, partial [Bacteroidia bacterium]|nr:DNA polymerase III subunit alpha [Bacteroidia bacterium]
MMREYILRFHDASRRTYAHPLLKNLMAETFGVMVYQEDVIKVAHHFAGLTLTEADMLRRGMSGKYRGRDEFKKVEKRFFENCNAKGYPPHITAEVWRQIESFAGYAFSKGHSASYAVESYQCMYLKTYYPLEFMVAVINNGGGFFSTQFYVHEARQCGATIEAPHINISYIETSISGNTITLGFNMIAELTQQVMFDLLVQRKQGHFKSLADFVNRVSISIDQLRLLIRSGAFRFTGRTKKQLLWDVHTLIGHTHKNHVQPQLFNTGLKNYILPALHHHRLDDALDEIELLGFPLCNPFLLLKHKTNLSFTAAHFAAHYGQVITIVGYLVTTKPSRTKQGQAMFFATWLDSAGRFFDTTHFPLVAQQYPARNRGCYTITGRVAHEFGFYSIDAISMQRLDFITYNDLASDETTAHTT